MAGQDWTDAENDLIVADYFSMLRDEIAGRRYVKARHNEQLRTQIDRSKGSVEFKHQNISAVLLSLGEVWIEGYKPAFNFQMPLAEAVARWLSKNETFVRRPSRAFAADALKEPGPLYIRPPPTLSNQPPPDDLEKTSHVARKFDVAERDARNRALGRAGEQVALAHERTTLLRAGCRALADRVRWVSDEDGDGAGYDIASFNPDGSARLIEVKTTNGWERTPFHLTRNELQVANERQSEWRLLRLWDFSREPKAFELYPPLEAHVSLMPTSFQASFH